MASLCHKVGVYCYNGSTKQEKKETVGKEERGETGTIDR